MAECIKAVLQEYNGIFLQDLPLGLPPVRMGHEFHIDLEDDTPPVPGHFTSSVHSSWRRLTNRFSICSSMGSSALPTLCVVHQCFLH